MKPINKTKKKKKSPISEGERQEDNKEVVSVQRSQMTHPLSAKNTNTERKHKEHLPQRLCVTTRRRGGGRSGGSEVTVQRPVFVLFTATLKEKPRPSDLSGPIFGQYIPGVTLK